MSFDGWLKKSEGKLFVYPIIPSLVSFVFALAASVVVNADSTGIAVCSNDVQAFVIGHIILSE